MSSFTTELHVTPMPDGRRWKLTRAFTYEIGKKGSGNKIKVPVGFITDFASVPKMFWGFISNWGKHGKAAVIHDYLYQNHKPEGKWFKRMFSKERKRADDIFLEGMVVLKVIVWKRRAMHLAVRLFSWLAWK